jgi:lipopolysaccharide/colanic/teichoic acid biosynthesis glycosyltransferase
MNMYRLYIKRILDLLAALSGLVVLFPGLIAIVPVIALSNNGPVFFRQQRPGRNGRLFTLYKFRTMNERRDPAGMLLSDSLRITKAGRVIRALSIDELPQLWNIIRGDMSLVGPRPLLPEYLPLYNSKQRRRHEVRPGITGWAQVNGRNSLSWEEKFEMDIWYVDNISFLLDLKILASTMKRVLGRNGINAGNGVTMERFRGDIGSSAGNAKVI